MADNEEYSKGGSQIHRYSPEQFRETCDDLGESSLEEIDAHISEYVGPPTTVLHEIISPTVHVDIHVVEPTVESNFYTLITSGMSDKPMNSPFKGFEYAEIVACLPAEWRIDEQSIYEETNYWPIRWLKNLSRFAHEYNTWIWESHTIPNGDPPRPFAENTTFSCILLSYPLLFDKRFRTLKIRDDKVIHFLSMVPIYTEEMEYKLENGLEPLYEKFNKHDLSDVIDIARPNLCV